MITLVDAEAAEPVETEAIEWTEEDNLAINEQYFAREPDEIGLVCIKTSRVMAVFQMNYMSSRAQLLSRSGGGHASSFWRKSNLRMSICQYY